MFKAAGLYFSIKNYDRAKEIYTELYESDSSNAIAVINLAEVKVTFTKD